MTGLQIFKPMALLFSSIALTGCNGASDSPPPSGQHADQSASASQEVIDALAHALQVEYRVVANKPGGCSAGGAAYDGAGPCYEGELSLEARTPISGDQWEMYFSQTEPVALVAPGEFVIEHVNGDLHRLRPADAFKGFEPSEKKTVSFVVRGQVLTEAKLLPNYFVVAEGAEPKIVESTRLRSDPETGLPVRPYIAALSDHSRLFSKGPQDATPLATASFLFDANKDTGPVDPSEVARGVIPTPKEIVLAGAGGRLDLAQGVSVSLEGVERSDIAAPLARLESFGVPERTEGVPVAVSLQPRAGAVEGAYTLEVKADSISINAADAAGAAYGLYSVASLIDLGDTTIPTLTIIDEPRFAFRGMHVDVARNFHSRQAILKILDQMAAYKLNKLHLHLADDEGWRLEIPGLPELTEVGARRCFDPEENECVLMQLGSGPTGAAPVDGYYSVADYTEILQAATARHIEVIPSLDMPGHARAAVKAMEARYRRLMAEGDEAGAKAFLLSDPDDATKYESIQYYKDNTLNVCMESTYAFIDALIAGMKKIHEEAGQPLTRYHIGADETAGAWKDSPACKSFMADPANGVSDPEKLGAYFIERVSTMLAANGVEPAGWNDGLGHTDPDKMPDVVQSNAWGVLSSGGAAAAHEQANRGWEVVISAPDALYFDFPYEADPKEGGYYWAARRVNTRKVFELMPENLPAHAEFWKDSSEQPFTVDDRAPLKRGVRFAGVQGQVWSETILTDGMLEYMVFPRLLALAERAWHKAEWEVPYDYSGAIYSQDTDRFTDSMRAARDRDWARFAAILSEKELPKLDRAGIAYRVPTVGARIKDGALEANAIFPGLAIEYREDGGAWRRYEGETPVSSDRIEVRALSADGTRPGRAIAVE